MSIEDNKTSNMYIKTLLDEGNTGLLKEAGTNAAKVMKLHANEGGIARQLLDTKNIGAADLFTRIDSTEPCTMIEISPKVQAGVEIPLETGTSTIKVNTKRLLVPLSRIASNRFYADSVNLMTYSVNIVDVVRDEFSSSIVDIEDSKVFNGLRTAAGDYVATISTGKPTFIGNVMGGTVAGTAKTRKDLTGAYGAVYDVNGTMDRAGIVNFSKAIASGNSGLRLDKTLMSDITELNIIAELDHNEAGGTYSEDMLFHGLSRNSFIGTPSLSTVKKNLIAENEVLCLVKPDQLGVFQILDETKFETISDNSYEIGFWAHEFVGMGIANVAGNSFYTAGGTKSSTVSWR